MTLQRRPPAAALLALLSALLLSACDAPETATAPDRGTAGTGTPDSAEADTDLRPLNDEAGATALANQRRAWREALAALLEAPDADSLAAARNAWADLYSAFNDHYLSLAAVACQRGVPERLERLDGWPFYPAYVDALPAWPDSGIVNDPALELTAANLRRQQGATSEGEIALGFQPLRLLVAGVPEAPRRAADFRGGRQEAAVPANAVEEDAAVQVDAPARRRTYLRLAGEQLEADLDALDGDAAGDPDSLRCALSTLDRRLALLDRQRPATDPEAGLYLSPRSIELIDASQPEAALSQLADDDNAALRRALEQRWPGFEKALEQARERGDWSPLGAWLRPAAGGIAPTAAVRG
ncbi:imelysin family protein [Alloalcanivorax sp. C16-1]|uniref:imelysin family protein n=1 Tax=Alloalcanivorax sp. C16-1 TaxID=3390051 RepID=UPI0039710789